MTGSGGWLLGKEGMSQEESPKPTTQQVASEVATRLKRGNYPPTRLQSTSEVEFWLEGAEAQKQEAPSRPPNRLESRSARQSNRSFRGESQANGKPSSSSLSSDFAAGVDPPVRQSPRLSLSSDGVQVGDELGGEQFEEQQLLEELAKPKQSFPRFSLSDIADNPELARAAKMELTGKSVNGDAASVVDSICDGASRITDLERVRFTAGTADRDAEREGQAGMEDVNILLKRLEVGKKSVVNLLKLIMKLHQAETAYSRTLLAVSRMSLSNIGSSESCKVAADGIVELPVVIGGAHAQISQSLVDCETKLKNVLSRFKVVSDEFTMKSQKVNVVLGEKRGALTRAITGHAQACKVVTNSQIFSPNAKVDPWLTEGQLARGHTDLIEAQYTLRTFLASAFSHVRDAETLRIQVTKHVLQSLMRCYGSAVEQIILPYTNNLEKVVGLMDPDQEILDLSATVDSHAKMAGNMEVQHAEEESLRCGDLFSSPDIIRQGELESRETGCVEWSQSHFVLTQAGFLYWFTGKRAGSVPTDSINLSRSSFTGGNPPEFKISETVQGIFSSKRTLVFRAPTVEDCCEWAISIREIITEAKSNTRKTGLARGSTSGSVKNLS